MYEIASYPPASKIGPLSSETGASRRSLELQHVRRGRIALSVNIPSQYCPFLRVCIEEPARGVNIVEKRESVQNEHLIIWQNEG